MIELEAYTCPHCEAEFTVNEVDGLASDIENETDNAAATARTETEAEFDGMVDPSDLPIKPRTIHDLAAAIRRGDATEGRRLLERIAEDLGSEHKNALECGWFSREAVA